MKERCWVIYKSKLVEVKNVAEGDHEFLMDPEDVYPLLDGIHGIVHTHECTCTPSLLDLEGMKTWRVPWIIVGRNCVKSYVWSDLGVTEVDVHTSLPEELHDLLVHPL